MYQDLADAVDRELVRTPLHESLLGTDPRIQKVNDLIRKLAQTNLTVLITGETGTGKDIAAHLLHRLSPRYGKPFIKVNCPAIPEGILESELFGYERGAFTGARTSKPGRFELADNGTIFLDEITETSFAIQSKLLQVLDGDPFMRVGGVRPIHTNVRVIAATNFPLDEAVHQRRLRKDVSFRLSEVVVRMISLREHREDIPLLAEHFNYNYCSKVGKAYEPLPRDALREMQGQDWPGNVRELGARVKEYVVTGDVSVLLEGEQEPAMEHEGPGAAVGATPDTEAPNGVPERRFMPLKEASRRAVEATERALIEETLRYTLWNRRKAARLLDISYSSLLRRIEAYNIGKPEMG